MREANTGTEHPAKWLMILSTVCVLLAVAPITQVSARAGHGARRCTHAGSRTVLATGSLRVYRTRRHPNRDTEDNVFACWRPTGRTTLLSGEDSTTTWVSAVKAAPAGKNVIAYNVHSEAGDHNYDLVTSTNVRSGAKIHDNVADESESSDPRIDNFIVTDQGSLAWDGTGRDCRTGGVIAIGTDGREQTLECPPASPSSVSNAIHGLSFAQGTLSWQDGQTPHSVPFS